MTVYSAPKPATHLASDAAGTALGDAGRDAGGFDAVLARGGDREPLLARVEPFVEVSTAALRQRSIDASIVARFEQLLGEDIGALTVLPGGEGLLRVLAEIKADIHYLKAAYLESERYRDPEFELPLPELREPPPRAGSLVLDMRAQISGRNWYEAEGDGRWAGPGLESTLVVPALRLGRYRLAVHVVDEILPGAIDNLVLLVNGAPVDLSRSNPSPRTVLVGGFSVDESHTLPFWSFKFRFDRSLSPASRGADDSRTLTVRFAGLELERVDV